MAPRCSEFCLVGFGFLWFPVTFRFRFRVHFVRRLAPRATKDVSEYLEYGYRYWCRSS